MSALPGKSILIIVENLPVPFDKRVWNEATSLSDAGYRVSIISPKGKGYERSYEEIGNICIYRHPLPMEARGMAGYILEYSAAMFWELFLTVKIFCTKGFDVIHACNPPDTIFIIGLIFKCFGKKFVFDHHDINPELYVAKFGRYDFGYRIMMILERLTFMSADLSIATNQSYKEIAVGRGHMRPERVVIVRSGPDLRKFQPVAPDSGLKRGCKFMVAYLGVMGSQEGLNYLLDAVRFIVHDRKRTEILFVLIGSGPEAPLLKRYSKQLDIEQYVQFTGRIPDEELITYLSTADVCVNPDVANDMNEKSTMNKVLEYMAMGKPIVQFDLREGRFSAQDASLYAKKNDPVNFALKILELLDDPQKRERMGRSGRERIENSLSWEYSEKELLSAYQSLFSGHV